MAKRGSRMGDEEVQRQQLESMTTTEITARTQENQQANNTFLEQLVTRASLQAYTEQQCNELLTLLQECMTYIEGIPAPLQWVGTRDELLARIKKKL